MSCLVCDIEGSSTTAARTDTFEVTVREAWENKVPQKEATFADASQTIAEMFPNAKILIRSNTNGSITLLGRTDTEDQAKQIASLVRKMFLVPVEDRIAVVAIK